MFFYDCKPRIDAKLQLTIDYNKEERDSKLLLSNGSMFDDFGNAYVFNSVIKAGEEFQSTQRTNLENSKSCEQKKDASHRIVSNSSYLPIHGHPELINLMGDVVWASSYANHVACVHAPGGTAAIRVVVDTIKLCRAASRDAKGNVVWISSPTWGNHLAILEHAGYQIKFYQYEKICHDHIPTLNFPLILQNLENAKENDVVFVQGNCHNPTGLDFSINDWEQLWGFCQQRKLILVIDYAFIGMAKGLDEDFLPIRNFADKARSVPYALPFFVAISLSKGFTLYNERVGLSYAREKSTAECSQAIYGQMKKVARTTYSNPPAYGARLICTLLKNNELKALWREELEQLRLRIHSRRVQFIEEMAKYQDKSILLENHSNRNTIFVRTGLSAKQVEYLRKKYAIYMNYSGLLNITTIDTKSLPLVCGAIYDALTNESAK